MILTGVFLQCYKEGLLKKENYKSTSLLPHLSNGFERITCKYTKNHLEIKFQTKIPDKIFRRTLKIQSNMHVEMK